MTKYFVTGGAGFIGSHLVERLVNDGHAVIVYDDFSSGRLENIAHLEGRHLTVIEGDVRDAKALAKAMKGAHFVLHQAARPSVARSIAEPLDTNAVNIDGTLNVLEAARASGRSVKRVVYASSSSVYGDTPTLPKVETMATQPMSPYAVSKLAAESYCRAYFVSYGLEVVALRYFNVFGPRQDPESPYAAVIPLFVKALMGRGKPVIFGDGKQTRDFTHVDNVVDANLAACTAAKAPGNVFNVAGGSRVTVSGLANMIGELLGVEREPRLKPARAGDIRHSLADIARAEEFLAYRPRVDLREGLARTVAWYSENS